MTFDRLLFSHLITGNVTKLEIIKNLTKTKLKDPKLSYQTALLLENVNDRVKLLAEAGHIPLAYTIARKCGLDELAVPLAEAIKNNPKMNQEILDVTIIII